MAAHLPRLSTDALTHPVQDLIRLDLPLDQLYEGVMERVFRGLDAGADECASFPVQRLDLGLVQMISSLGTHKDMGRRFDSRGPMKLNPGLAPEQPAW